MKPALPKSETHFGTNLLGFFVALATIFLLKDVGLTKFDTALAVLAASVVPVLLIEFFIFKRHREPSASLTALRPASVKRVAVKCFGLLAILGLFAALYTLFPEYDKRFYDPAWPFYLAMLPAAILIAPFYFTWCDARQDIPEDGYYHLGRMLLKYNASVDTHAITCLLRNWLVKAFFLPLMFVYTLEAIYQLQYMDLTPSTFIELFLIAQAIIMFGDLLYATLGYIFTLRIFNAHIRSSEPTFLGWAVAVLCYYPFWQLLFYNSYFTYQDSYEWMQLIPQGIWQYVWGSTILVCLVIYVSSTISLGVRFSNLTYRGLVTNGCYRFSKHPGYVGKNLSWWLISIPFISNEGIGTAIAHSAALLGINVIYFIRARTEERHLSNYPEYVEYALAMNERSIFAPLAKRVPFLIYKKPETLPRV
ncbi:MAG: DUF1295 domain-containing protein [Alphaproteobacteria bacterium]|nr:DUF1295 domain-containing protein [Alphaproteobacteria bacterium]